MTNVTVPEALKAAIEALEYVQNVSSFNYDRTLRLCKSALADIDKCEPVALADEHIISTISIEMIKELETRSGNKFPYHLWPTKLYTSPISKECEDWQYFDEAYKKATESSEPDDWMNAALMAQQVRRKQLNVPEKG